MIPLLLSLRLAALFAPVAFRPMCLGDLSTNTHSSYFSFFSGAVTDGEARLLNHLII